jgi:hypothetical protein
MTYLGTSIDFIDGARVHFEEGASLPADAPVPVACDVCQKASKRRPKIIFTANNLRDVGIRGMEGPNLCRHLIGQSFGWLALSGKHIAFPFVSTARSDSGVNVISG